MTTSIEYMKKVFLENFCDGDTWEDAKAVTFTRDGAFDVFMFALQQRDEEWRDNITEDTSDGYHTFRELYEFRLLYNAHLFNEWSEQGKYDVHKSKRHNDGELCFGRDDYFVVVATLPTGQISNHYPMSAWDLFRCEAVEKAKTAWDGHTSQDVATRLRSALTPPLPEDH